MASTRVSADFRVFIWGTVAAGIAALLVPVRRRIQFLPTDAIASAAQRLVSLSRENGLPAN